MSKPKVSAENKVKAVKEYLNGRGSHEAIGEKYGVCGWTVSTWVLRYQQQGETAFIPKARNSNYSVEFKIRCVEAFLRGEGSANEIAAKYNISSRSVFERWIKHYNANVELKDYNPSKEVYMASARRKTTLEERKGIVEYCLAHEKDYKGTAIRYRVSYDQVYSWVKKYLTKGEEGLADKRGHHKSDDEVDEMERLRRENARLKRQLEERDMVVELLKKAKDFEGM